MELDKNHVYIIKAVFMLMYRLSDNIKKKDSQGIDIDRQMLFNLAKDNPEIIASVLKK